MDPSPAASAPSLELQSTFGAIDIYLFDQLLRGRFDRRRRVLDAGCGEGRNLPYFLTRGDVCYGIDRDPSAIAAVRLLAARSAPHLPADHFRAGELDDLPWDAVTMDAVICSAVLHFSSDAAHFGRMVQEMWRVLAPDGLYLRAARVQHRPRGRDRPGRPACPPARRLRPLRRRRDDTRRMDRAPWRPAARFRSRRPTCSSSAA
jgi:SAM-dependent methyltransferase